MSALPVTAAHAEAAPRQTAEARIPRQLNNDENARFRAIFSAIDRQQWADAAARIDAEPTSALAHFARAELYLAKGSPRVELPQLLALLSAAPTLPQAEQLARLAKIRGATDLPDLPDEQRLIWAGGAPVRGRADASKDAAAAALAEQMAPLIKDDRAEEAEALLAENADALSPEARTEWQARVAWIYYLVGDDRNARRMAASAQRGAGEWAAQADWTQGLASWRMNDCAAAGQAFQTVAQRAGDVELRAGGHYWASRASMRCGRPDLVQSQLRGAAAFDETFYGQLARGALGMDAAPSHRMPLAPAEWASLENRPNVRIAAALTEIGEARLADETLRHQARIGAAADHTALLHLASRLDLAATQLWLSHNCPNGVRPPVMARYPAPDWTPEGGLRVDRSLLFAHALQESRFRTEVVSPAGAYGLMQIMPAAAIDYSRRTGKAIDRAALRLPAINMAIGQSHLEALRDRPGTGGLLPKVIAAFNAGLTPVERWNLSSRDKGDPLLYIESIPYWETRGYVGTVLRNYWMYQQQAGVEPISRAALVQGMWPRFPGIGGPTAVRLDSVAGVASAN
ncbi:lytic transglycosylase domain-containing protein [Sphingomonas gilva]|uniref:Lytic transglycosylase domain-containing protein n=2 Tax=Sphingomonas gilva TaxID=2305907 RepID=A0A396RUE7_9SPHN|nr:lytic transglycosylase domain-containing protein [Sphingomonas gilva]